MTNSASQINAYRVAMIQQINARIDYEFKKCNDVNASIIVKMQEFIKLVDHDAIAKHFLACDYDVTKINRQLRSNARYNEKAFVKDLNIVQALAHVDSLNKYSSAILHTIAEFALCDLDALTQSEAASCCSNDGRIANKERNAKLIRVKNYFLESTVSTQVSSSINSLEALNIIKRARNASNQVTLHINADSVAFLALASQEQTLN